MVSAQQPLWQKQIWLKQTNFPSAIQQALLAAEPSINEFVCANVEENVHPLLQRSGVTKSMCLLIVRLLAPASSFMLSLRTIPAFLCYLFVLPSYPPPD